MVIDDNMKRKKSCGG